ncbi:MAG TPA: LON peptidase substrate-binding domain-containing protein [Candidatus Limnocylindrales bacterium]|jgi:Lon protease-like protein|nr:LON peptidase substrate-binding domain-containing protein [Candidatus Limnocylindrales bacterium]
MTAPVELPLFPLNTVLCPGIALPLHIFEERYRALVRHCIETTSPFGIVLIREGREVGTGAISFTGIGTIAEIRDAGRDDDGQFDLLVVGTRRFEIRRVLSGRRPYLVAEVDLLDETIGDEPNAERLAMKATRRFVSYLELLQPRLGETADEIDVRVEVETEDDDEPDDDEAEGFEADVDPDMLAAAAGEGVAAMGTIDDEPRAPRRRRVMIPDDPTILSYLLAGILQIEAPRRQALLEAATTETRLRGLLRLIDREVFLLERRLRFFRPEVRLVGPRRS